MGRTLASDLDQVWSCALAWVLAGLVTSALLLGTAAAQSTRSSGELVVGPFEVLSEGYVRFQRSRQLVELLDRADGFLAQSGSDSKRPNVSCTVPKGFVILGAVAEAPGRSTFVAGPTRGRLMLHHTDRRVLGGEARFAQDLLNITVRGNPGILSLSVSIPNTERALWRAVWQDAESIYEVYFDDVLLIGQKPSKPKEVVVSYLAQIHCERTEQKTR